MVWYPREELIIYIHDEQVKEYGGRLGFHRDRSLLTLIINETRRCEGDIFHKAAFLLRKTILTHVFKDGQHRTGFVMVDMFLRENHRKMYHSDYLQARTFLKRIRTYSIQEIVEWLKYGRVP